MKKYQMFIDGKFVDAASGETRPTYNPATEEPIAEIPLGSKVDAKKAIEAARKSFDSGVWSNLKPKERASRLMKFVEKLDERQSELAELESRDSGATMPQSHTL